MTRRKPWEQQEGESTRAFDAFVGYRDAGPQRSIAKLAGGRQNTGARVRFEGWSRKHQWVERVGAWDRELDRKRREVALHEVAEMQRRHVQAAQGLQSLAVRELQKLLRQSEASGEALVITPDQVRWFLKDGTGMERLAMGEPTDVQQVNDNQDARAGLENMTADQIKLQKVLNKVARGEVLSDAERAQLLAAGAG